MRKVAFLFAAFAAPALAQQPAPASLVREGVTEKLTRPRMGHPGRLGFAGPQCRHRGRQESRAGHRHRHGHAQWRNCAARGHQGGRRASLSTSSRPTCIPNMTWARTRSPRTRSCIRSKDQIEDIAAGAGMNLVPVFAQRSALNVGTAAGRETPRRRHRVRRRLLTRPGWLEGKDLRHGHQPHARRYGGVRRRRAVLGRRGHAPAASFANPTAKISHWLASLDKLEA